MSLSKNTQNVVHICESVWGGTLSFIRCSQRSWKSLGASDIHGVYTRSFSRPSFPHTLEAEPESRLALPLPGQLWSPLRLGTNTPHRLPLLAASLAYPAWALRLHDPPTAS